MFESKLIKILKITVILLGSASFYSCHFFDRFDPEVEPDTFEFSTTKKTIKEGGIGECDIVVEPKEALEYFDVTYESSNETIVSVYKADNTGVVFYGERVGSALIYAYCSNEKAVLLVNVEE